MTITSMMPGRLTHPALHSACGGSRNDNSQSQGPQTVRLRHREIECTRVWAVACQLSLPSHFREKTGALAMRTPHLIHVIAHGHTVRSATALEVHQRAVEGAFDMQTAQLGCRHTALTQIGSRRCRPTARGRFRVQAAVLTIPRDYSKVRTVLQRSFSGHAHDNSACTLALFGYKT